MNIVELSKRVVRELTETISADLPEAKHDAVSKIVHQGLLDASLMAFAELKEAANMPVGPDISNSKTLQEQVDKERNMLISNLSSMR